MTSHVFGLPDDGDYTPEPTENDRMVAATLAAGILSRPGYEIGESRKEDAASTAADLYDAVLAEILLSRQKPD